LLILQGTNPVSLVPSQDLLTAPVVSVAPITTNFSVTNMNNYNNNNNNAIINNNNNTIINNNNNNYETKNYQKPIKPAQGKAKKKKKSGTTPPLKPPKKFRDEDNEILRCKRRLDFAKLGLPFNKANPVAVARRNERERKRVKQINSTFSTLRDHLPSSYYQNKNPNKLSKVETLRGAIDYINTLQEMLDDYDSVNKAFQAGRLSQGGTPTPEQQQEQKEQDAQFQMELSEALHNVNQILSVHAAGGLQNIQVNSPTGSTCSSVCSAASSAETPGSGVPSTSPDCMDVQYSGSAPVYQTDANIPQSTPNLQVSLDEEDLMEFASWF